MTNSNTTPLGSSIMEVKTPGEIRAAQAAHVRRMLGIEDGQPLPHPHCKPSPALAEADRLRRVAYHS